MGFQALPQELAMGSEVEDLSKTGITNLDDDKEWVLLTCDADLKECIDIHKSSRSHTTQSSLRRPLPQAWVAPFAAALYPEFRSD